MGGVAVTVRLVLDHALSWAAIAVLFLAACNNGNGGGAPGYLERRGWLSS